MKTLRTIAPALAMLAVFVVAVFAIGLMSRGQEAPLVDTGPNAALSNQELVAKAISNTVAARSFHVDFNAGLQVPELSLRESYTLTGELGPAPQQARLRASYLREGAPDFRETFLSFGTVMTATTDVRASAASTWEESYDGGATWIKPADFTPVFVSTLFLCPLEASIWLMCDGREVFLDSQTFNDAVPSTEEQDGVAVRHFVAQYKTPEVMWASTGPMFAWVSGTKTIELWVPTGATPTITQMKIAGVYDVMARGSTSTPGPKVGNGIFTLTYRLSRFNEDFGAANIPSVAEPTPTPLPAPTAPPAAAPPPAAGMPRTGEELGAEPHLLDVVLIAALATALAGLLVRLVASRR